MPTMKEYLSSIELSERRARFAIAALTGVMATVDANPEAPMREPSYPRLIATLCFELADAMIAEADKPVTP